MFFAGMLVAWGCSLVVSLAIIASGLRAERQMRQQTDRLAIELLLASLHNERV